MDTNKEFKKDALAFAKLLSSAKLSNQISIGNFILKGKYGVKDKIQYNQADLDLLKNSHEYTFSIQEGELQVSLQLYENLSNHYRLFCYTKIKNNQGLTFSLNLTTTKESDNIIYLTQKLKFKEQYTGNATLAKAHRSQKQIIFTQMLQKLGFDIRENNDIILGVFDPQKKQLINTTLERFLNDFIVVSVLKGHFQGNKGYQLEILPTYDKLEYIFTGKEEEKNELPLKVAAYKTKRIIPLGFYYKVFKKNGFKCVACGRSAIDGIKLHVDHKIPFTLGGLTELNNLQTLCNECNLSKSNKFIDE